MTAKDAIRYSLESSKWLLTTYLADLSDADLMVRPVPAANHTAWQLGHLISEESKLLASQFPDNTITLLPGGFSKDHRREMAAGDDPAAFRPKAEYLKLFEQVRAGTISALEGLTENELDRPTTGPFAPFASTLGSFFLFVSNHTLMHAGQLTTARRKLGKPVLM